jgi:hypothetical protein
MRPSFQELPSWLSRLPAVPQTPPRAFVPPEHGLLRRVLANSRLSVHVALLAVVLGVAAAAAAGSVRAKHTAQSRAEMSSFAARKIAELRAFETLRTLGARKRGATLAAGGSLIDDVPGYFDVVEGTEGRRFQRRWVIEAEPSGRRRLAVRVLPLTRHAGDTSLDLEATLAAH